MMEYLSLRCSDDSCCCLHPKITLILIALFSMVPSIYETPAREHRCRLKCCSNYDDVQCCRALMSDMFLLSSCLLLVAVLFDVNVLIQIYVYVAMTYVMTSFVTSTLDFYFRFQHGCSPALRRLVLEAGFLFALFPCLPLVEQYSLDQNGIYWPQRLEYENTASNVTNILAE